MEIDEMIKVLQAKREGKTIQFRDRLGSGSSSTTWQDLVYDVFDFVHLDYRIKPEPRYRPFKNQTELMSAIKEHGIVVRNCTYDKFQVTFNSENIALIDANDYALCYEFGGEALRLFVFMDGTPFGVIDEE